MGYCWNQKQWTLTLFQDNLWLSLKEKENQSGFAWPPLHIRLYHPGKREKELKLQNLKNAVPEVDQEHYHEKMLPQENKKTC